MIHPTPQITDEFRQYLHSNVYRDWAIMSRFPGYEACFVCFAPFLKVKEGHQDQILFEPGRPWPDKVELEANCEPVSWVKILQLTGIRNVLSLDCVLAFFHSAYRYAEKAEIMKLWELLKSHRPDLVIPDVDVFPKILENRLYHKLQQLGYDEVYVYSDNDPKDELKRLTDLIADPDPLPGQPRVETPDSRILIVQDFDLRFSYWLSSKAVLTDLMESMDLEGFFCDEFTQESWSMYQNELSEIIDSSGFQAIKSGSENAEVEHRRFHLFKQIWSWITGLV